MVKRLQFEVIKLQHEVETVVDDKQIIAEQARELRRLKGRLETAEKEIVLLLRAVPWLHWHKFRRALPKVVYRLTRMQNVEAMEAFDGLVDAYCVLKGKSVNRLLLYRGPDTVISQTEDLFDEFSPHKVQALQGIEQMFFALFVLRTGTDLTLADAQFGICDATSTRYFITWLDVLARVLMLEMPYPNQELMRATVPQEYYDAFGPAAGRLCVVWDATNTDLEAPSDPDVNHATYSQYYGDNVTKSLIGTSCTGAIILASLALPGCIGDPLQTKVSPLALGMMEKGDDAMADKGFTVHDTLFELGSGTHMPPKHHGGIFKFRPELGELSVKIANKRIHVERAMKRIKAYSFLKRVVAVTMWDLVSHAVFVVFMLSNLQPPLRGKDLSL